MKERDDARQRESEEVIPVNNGRRRGTQRGEGGKGTNRNFETGKAQGRRRKWPDPKFDDTTRTSENKQLDAVVVLEEDGR